MKMIAVMQLSIFTYQLLQPSVAMALTTGPSQPEVQSFEPVGTTDMVDMFSGDFVYNIPLMDVEGYPVNISYHGGVTMEQEASWVGLGWNINPGVINRSVRGVPDDFNGDTLAKELNIKPEKTLRVGLGVGGEIVGLGDPNPFLTVSLSAGTNLTINNYRGVSCDFTFGGGISVFHCVSAGINMGIGSQTGASIDYNAGLNMSSSQILSSDQAAGIGVGVNGGYSTRSGIKDMNFSVTVNGSADGVSTGGSIFGGNIPIGVKNYVPVITNSSTMNSVSGKVKIGLEFFWMYPYGTISGMFNKLTYNNDGSKDAYGYMYLQNASIEKTSSIMDFTRDKDGSFNKTMQYLPPGGLTYDIYSVCGQGTGGMFRPFRNDFGSVYDPSTSSGQDSKSFSAEAGIGDLFEIGVDYTNTHTDISSGPWINYQRGYTPKTSGSVYEDVYLKQGGEMTSVDPTYFSTIGGTQPLTPESAKTLPAAKPHSSSTRDARGNLVYYFTAQEDTTSGVGTNPYIMNYTDTTFMDGAIPAATAINRIGTTKLDRKKDQISEVVQVQKDGRRYNYGIPAMNHIQKEVTFSVNPPSSSTDLAAGLVPYTIDSDDATINKKGMDNYYSSTVTPSFAHSYLLTSVLSSDYVDVTGNGITDDDLGTYTKFNYSLKENDYRWKAPFGAGKAQYNPGFWSEPRDDKGSYVSGSREEWMLHSIETKNFVAEFYTSKRNDACGSTEAIAKTGTYAIAPYNAPLAAAAHSYKLDSIKLYNKHDRFINKTAAVPIKTVFLVYTDTLCSGVPNTISGSGGKLTLSKIYFRYGSSQKSMISPYQFAYGYNPGYNLSAKDRWGNYKPNVATYTNYEFPYVNQNDASDNTYASAWSLTNITLPSGGIIQAAYESDDYAFVQDKPAAEMFMINGVGSGPDYNNANQLYGGKNSPDLYAYFTRRIASENSSLSFAQNYYNQSCMYFNFDVRLTDKNNSYEPIKGYATVADIGACSDGVHGYIKLQPVTPAGSGALLNPVAYTALNVSRYNLPQIIFPGDDPDESSLMNMISGMKEAFASLVSLGTNPIIPLIKNNDAKLVNLNKSYVRLQSVGLRKKGGGQRVKSLTFYDSWKKLAGGNEQDATYGKNYDYTIKDQTYGTISSGVASYEPLIGGDENPLRMPVQYTVQSGSNWPPNDPVDLYQETPIGESLYPPASVGYSKITVTSIHSSQGKSSQGVDLYEFYTAKDFPAKFSSSAINSKSTNHFDLFSQQDLFTATQGYSLVFNDMHGKPKRVEHDVYIPDPSGIGGSTQPISYQVYNYNQDGNGLNNTVNCLAYQGGGSPKFIRKPMQLGVESDVTIDTRQKNEQTHTDDYNVNINTAGLLWLVIPIPFPYGWAGDYQNEFQSAVVTKVTQQYGILDNVQSFNEGAVTTVTNELFDSLTGQVVATSVNNEFQDKQYSVNIPAYWSYTAMGPAYANIKYECDIDTVAIDTNYNGHFKGIPTELNVGDELLMDFKDAAGVQRETIAWFMGGNPLSGSNPCHFPLNSGLTCCAGTLLPRFPKNTPGWMNLTNLTKIHLKVIRSGLNNQLDKNIESYTTMDDPGVTGLQDTLTDLISLKAMTYCDSNTVVPGYYIIKADSVNPFSIGQRGLYRLQAEYAYIANRNAGTSSRNAGLFNANSLFGAVRTLTCTQFPYNYMEYDPGADPNWHFAREITKYSPSGKEIENVDPIGNYSTAQYGYNEQLPVAVASNAKQGEILADGFEDYNLLQNKVNIMNFRYSPLNTFAVTDFFGSGSTYDIYQLINATALSVVTSAAHTGLSCLSVPATGGGIAGVYQVGLPLQNSINYGTDSDHLNPYYYPSYHFSTANVYMPMSVIPGKSYVLSFWIQQPSAAPNLTDYAIGVNCGVAVGATIYPVVKKSNIIDGWQQVEVTFPVSATATAATLLLPLSYYVDDLRIFPADGNMKSFVYNPVNEKLMATLDENNFATFYEYDQEGNLVRTKKETQKGIMTISESRSNNPKQ